MGLGEVLLFPLQLFEKALGWRNSIPKAYKSHHTPPLLLPLPSLSQQRLLFASFHPDLRQLTFVTLSTNIFYLSEEPSLNDRMKTTWFCWQTGKGNCQLASSPTILRIQPICPKTQQSDLWMTKTPTSQEHTAIDSHQKHRTGFHGLLSHSKPENIPPDILPALNQHHQRERQNRLFNYPQSPQRRSRALTLTQVFPFLFPIPSHRELIKSLGTKAKLSARLASFPITQFRYVDFLQLFEGKEKNILLYKLYREISGQGLQR